MLHFTKALRCATMVAGFLLLALAAPSNVRAQQAVNVGATDIGGVVTSTKGPEAGVWVIAQTTELPTKFVRIVVTDDHGRYLIPDLPQADYSVWVRGYGLVDSPKMRAKPGMHLDLTAVVAPTAAEAAHYYPAIYWYSMLKIPDKRQFGGKSDIPANIKLNDWLVTMKNRDCIGCHQLGQEATRTIPAVFSDHRTSEEAWMRRVQSGQAAPLMVGPLAGKLAGAPFKYFADWTDRIAKGELPFATPPRPQGVERNVVITEWSWGQPNKYLHDEISTDKRNPTVNAYGRIFGSPEYSTDTLPILDPKTNVVSSYTAPVRDPNMPESLGPGHAAAAKPMAPSAYWGDKQIWDTRFNNHDSMFDEEGRLWLAAAIRAPANPAVCKKGSDNPYAKNFPIEKSERQIAMLDPKTMKMTFIDACFGSHHLQFGFDADRTLWTSGGGLLAGWIKTKEFEKTGDAFKSQGWMPFILDTNGDGKRDAGDTRVSETDPKLS